MPNPNGIGTLSEKSLHAGLKDWFAREGDQIEAEVDGFQIDIKRGDLLIEIQTGNFSAIKRKLRRLVESHPVLLIHPIAEIKWIVRLDSKGKQVGRRKSPKRGKVEDLFGELIRIPKIVASPKLKLEVLLVELEELWIDDGRGSWRRGRWSIHDRKLLRVNRCVQLYKREDFLALIPGTLERPFTVKELAAASQITQNQSQKMTYSMRKMGLLEVVSKRGNAYVLDLAIRN